MSHDDLPGCLVRARRAAHQPPVVLTQRPPPPICHARDCSETSRVDTRAGQFYIRDFVRAGASISLVLIVLAGCAARKPVPMTEADAAMFAPLSMRIHPIFTDAKDWNGDGQPDGVEALLEFQDQFNDPTKAAGKVIFELFSYRAYHADTRGDRVVNPWVVSLQTLDDQQARWNRTSRTYSFR